MWGRLAPGRNRGADPLVRGKQTAGIGNQPVERHQSTRLPLNVNAVLLDKETMPRGCRVRDVSQCGMLLHWGPGKQMPPFGEGDSVEIHLSLRQRRDSRQSLSIPAIVRRVNEDRIGVEFQHLGPELVELIASHGISESDELKASIAPRPAGQARAQDIVVEQHRVTVKGREFWRVQVTGFATAKAARSYADSARKKLGFKDVWIFKRRASFGLTDS